jgi:hypothetical protein
VAVEAKAAANAPAMAKVFMWSDIVDPFTVGDLVMRQFDTQYLDRQGVHGPITRMWATSA